MIRGLYTAAAGMAVATRWQEVLSNNLTNASTPGYKGDRLLTQSFPGLMLSRLNDQKPPGWRVSLRPQVGWLATGAAVRRTAVDFTPGALKETGSPLDLAISGSGFFVVQTDAGEAYTRAGTFTLDQAGRLVTRNGHLVLGVDGVLEFPSTDRAGIVVARDGSVRSGERVLGRLRIVDFTDRSVLTKMGGGLFRAVDVPVEATGYEILQGYLEESNVQAVVEMVRMIETMRSYEANQKAIQAHDQALGKAVNEVGASS